MYDQQLLVDIAAPIPVDGDPLATVYEAMEPTTAADTDHLARAVLVRNLLRIRIAQQLRQVDVAAAIGISSKAVQLWEQGADGVMVAPAQRYARAIGAPLTFRLTPVDALVGVAA